MCAALWQPLRWPLWARALVFKAGWISLVLWQNVAAVPVCIAMLWLWSRLVQAEKKPQLQAILLLTMTGLVVDLALVAVGWLTFQADNPWYYVVVWAWFATAWHWCFAHWFGKGFALVIFASLVPLAYLGGAALGGDMVVSHFAIYTLGPLWFCLLVFSQWQLRQSSKRATQ